MLVVNPPLNVAVYKLEYFKITIPEPPALPFVVPAPPPPPPPAPEATVTVDAMQSWRKAALLTIGAGVGTPFDAELTQCKTKTETRAVFERHWPKTESEITRLAEALEAATKAVTNE